MCRYPSRDSKVEAQSLAVVLPLGNKIKGVLVEYSAFFDYGALCANSMPSAANLSTSGPGITGVYIG